jgi:trans-4-hydroxy-L-proline dehydratase
MNFMDHCRKKTIYLVEGELIAGERGPRPKCVPTFPELTCHTAEDFHILNTRIFSHVPDEWRAAYEAGLFTEFMEQRAPGHTALDGKIYQKGMLDFKREISCDAVIVFAERHADLAEIFHGQSPDLSNTFSSCHRVFLALYPKPASERSIPQAPINCDLAC